MYAPACSLVEEVKPATSEETNGLSPKHWEEGSTTDASPRSNNLGAKGSLSEGEEELSLQNTLGNGSHWMCKQKTPRSAFYS